MAARKEQILVRTRLVEGMKLISRISHLEMLFLEDSMGEIQLIADKDMEVIGNVIFHAVQLYIYTFAFMFELLGYCTFYICMMFWSQLTGLVIWLIFIRGTHIVDILMVSALQVFVLAFSQLWGL